jgi:hypothetical protein
LHFQAEALHMFALPSAFAMAIAYLMAYAGMKRFISNFSKNQLLVVNQEELKDEPRQIAEKICKFLNIPLCSNMLSWIKRRSQNQSIKNWKHEMKAEDIKAVEAAAHFMGIDLPGGPYFDSGYNSWIEKARSVSALVGCTKQSFASTLKNALELFGPADCSSLSFALVKIGDYHLSRGNFETAYLFFNSACSLIEDNAVIWFKFAELCFDMKLLTQSRNCLLKANNLMTKDSCFNLLRAKSFYQLGSIERIAGKNSDARVWFERSLIAFPGFKLSQEILKLP